MIRVVLDTNILLVSISSNAPLRWVVDRLMRENYILCVTTDILLEYEEIISRHMGEAVAQNVLESLENAPTVELITRYFIWNLIEADPDDNKFVDCAIAGNATFIVSEDRHFRILRTIGYPKVEVIGVEEFREVLEKED
ncbi:MAG: putative toxin-antitoxin system toxin component, PIN family [Saprospiraceae bacterium]